MAIAVGPVAETRFGKVRVEDRRQDLCNGLLDQSVDHVWDAEVPLTAIRLRDGLSSDRFHTISSIEKLLSDRLPTRSEPLGKVVDRDSVRTRGPAVGFDFRPGLFHVEIVDNVFHQRDRV